MNDCEKAYVATMENHPRVDAGTPPNEKVAAIGGYFGFEGCQRELPNPGFLLNSARSALRWILRTFDVRKVHLPSFTCPVVEQAVRDEGCAVETYALGKDFLPTEDFLAEDWVVFNNYFGVCGKNVTRMALRYRNLIVDNAQAFYAKPAGRAAFYSPRKFFGVPDGGIAVIPGWTGDTPDLEPDHSLGRITHLFRRLEEGPKAGFAEFRAADRQLDGLPVRAMSATTRAMLGCCDFAEVARRRLANFRFLHERLHSTFPFALEEDDVPLAYPYITRDSDLREKLIAQRIFVPLYWPGVAEGAYPVEGILPLPIDQRYSEEDMKRIVENILK